MLKKILEWKIEWNHCLKHYQIKIVEAMHSLEESHYTKAVQYFNKQNSIDKYAQKILMMSRSTHNFAHNFEEFSKSKYILNFNFKNFMSLLFIGERFTVIMGKSSSPVKWHFIQLLRNEAKAAEWKVTKTESKITNSRTK